MSFKEFSWERYQAGEEVQYRQGGVPVEILLFKCVNPDAQRMFSADSFGVFHRHYDNGCWHSSSQEQSKYDLVMKPKKRTVWVNLYKNVFSIVTCGNTFKSKEDAENIKSSFVSYIGSFPIEIEE